MEKHKNKLIWAKPLPGESSSHRDGAGEVSRTQTKAENLYSL